MRAPVETCFRRTVVAVLASGVVLSISALSGGVAPAFAKPGHDDPVIPTVPTEVAGPPGAPQGGADEQPRAEQSDGPKSPAASAGPGSPAEPVGPAPEPQAEAPLPQQLAPQSPAPQVEVPPVAPSKERPPIAPPPVDIPKVDVPKVDVPKVDAPKVDAPKVDAPRADAPKVDTPNVDVPKVDTPTVDAPRLAANVPTIDTASPPADQPVEPAGPDTHAPKNLVAPVVGSAAPDVQQKEVVEASEPEAGGTRGDQSAGPSTRLPISKAAQRIPVAAPDTMVAPEPDIQLARQAKPVEVKPEPAAKLDVDFLSSALNVDNKTKLGPFQPEFNMGSEFSIGGSNHDRDRDHEWDWQNKHWDKKVRQWDRRWIEYDDYYRPVFFNPYRAPVRLVYLYERAPRIVILPPLGRVLVDTAAVAAYSFTAVVLNAANLAADVAVGTFFGGGIIPTVGAPFMPPPPLLRYDRYDNVPVQVRYSNATYDPFLVRQIVDLGDDVQYGGRKVLLDGATPAWGQWTTSPNGERQFEVHRTQQYPGLGDPQEAPLPGDYQMRLASDESANADHTQTYLMAAAGLVSGLGFGALGLALYLGRRRLPR